MLKKGEIIAVLPVFYNDPRFPDFNISLGGRSGVHVPNPLLKKSLCTASEDSVSCILNRCSDEICCYVVWCTMAGLVRWCSGVSEWVGAV